MTMIKRRVLKHNRKNLLLLGLLVVSLMLLGLIAGCTSNKTKSSGTKSETKSETKSSVKDFDACVLLADVKPESLLGEAVNKGRKSLDIHNANQIASRCGYSAKNNWQKTVSLMIKYYPNSSNPKTAKDALDINKIKKSGLFTDPKSQEVKKIGDMAVVLTDKNALELRTFWQGHYQITVSFTGIDNTKALGKAKTVTRHVLDKLNK